MVIFSFGIPHIASSSKIFRKLDLHKTEKHRITSKTNNTPTLATWSGSIKCYQLENVNGSL